MKKILALVLAMMLVLGMTSAMAASITLKSDDTHTYKVFQVLTGTLATEGSKQLGNPAWGADATEAAKATDVNTFITEITASGLSEADIAAKVAAKVDTTKAGQGNVTASAPLTNLATGYYVLVDTTTLEKYGSNPEKIDTKSLNVVQVLNNVTLVSIKYGTTEDDKKIIADTLAKDGEEKNEYNPGVDNDNVSIGDTVTYNLACKVPENADKFKAGTFFYVITDKLSSGLTFTTGSIKVFDGTTELAAEKYHVQYDINGNTFEIGLINAAQYAGKTINVQYKAVLNENAVIGDEGNPNTSKVKFSNDPNKTYDGEPEDTQHPGFPDSTKNVPTGETPETETITYSTGIKILKVDQNGEPLTSDVTFELSGQSAKKVVTKTEAFTVDDEDGTYYKLKNNTYTKVAPTTENTMIDAENGATKGYVEDNDASGEGVITIGEKKYRAYVPATDAGKHIYVLQEGSADAYADTHKYAKTVTQKTVDSNVTDHKMSESVDSNGIVRFDGLGAGTYTIKETQTPDGYNTIPNFDVVVTYTADGEAKFTTTSSNVVYEDGVFKVKVINKKGAELPSTGGIGTTIFYVAGSILVLAAAILLITKRRMGADD